MRWVLALVLLVACDDLNKPMNHPASPKFPPESSSSSSSSSGGTASDGGASNDASPSPAPSITAQPGDIQL